MRGQMAYLNGAAGSAGKQAAHFFLQRTFQALPTAYSEVIPGSRTRPVEVNPAPRRFERVFSFLS